MWECAKCSEKVEDNFDVCWNCSTSKEGVEGTPAGAPEIPVEALTCAKCRSDKIIPRVRIIDRGYHSTDELTVVFYEDPDALIFKGAHEGSLSARVCGACGYTELFLDNAEDLYSLYKDREDRRTASMEEDKSDGT